MHPDEVVIHHVGAPRHKRGSPPSLRTHWSAREAAPVHPHCQVMPLHVRRADVFRVGLPHNPRLARANAFGGAVAAFGALGLCVFMQPIWSLPTPAAKPDGKASNFK